MYLDVGSYFRDCFIHRCRRPSSNADMRRPGGEFGLATVVHVVQKSIYRRKSLSFLWKKLKSIMYF